MPVPPPPELTVKELTEDSTLSVGLSGIVRNRVFRVENLSVDTIPDGDGTADWLDAALQSPGVPKRGDSYSVKEGEIFCLDLQAKHVGPAKDKAIVTAVYGEIGKSILATLWLVGMKLNASNVNTLTSIDPTTNKLLKVGYDTTVGPTNFDVSSASPTDISSGKVLVQYARVPSLEGLSSFSFSCREADNPSAGTDQLKSVYAKQQYYSGATNSVEIWGCPIGSLRLRMMVGAVDPVRGLRVSVTGDDNYSLVWDTEYCFEKRDRNTGWKELATLKLPWTGHEPPDIEDPGTILNKNPPDRTSGNGWGLFGTTKQVDFNELALPDPRSLSQFAR